MEKNTQSQTDYGFMRLFLNSDSMLNFLNNLMEKLKKPLLEKIIYLKDDQNPSPHKNILFSLKVYDEIGESYVVDLQKEIDLNSVQKVALYPKNEDEDDELCFPALVITIVEKTIFPKNVEYISHHSLKIDGEDFGYIQGTEYVFIELGKFKVENSQMEMQSDLDAWLYILSSMTQDEPSSKKAGSGKISYLHSPVPSISTASLDKNISAVYGAMEKALWKDKEF